MSQSAKDRRRQKSSSAADGAKKPKRITGYVILFILVISAAAVWISHRTTSKPSPVSPLSGRVEPAQGAGALSTDPWIVRTDEIDKLFHRVYTPCWEGAYGAIGDAHLFAVTHDSSLLRFYVVQHRLPDMCEGTWVDDRAWVCLAEMYWWRFTGGKSGFWVSDAMQRYAEARREGRLSHHEGFWSWYNWPPGASGRGQIFTNSNMNQMATVACWLFEASGDSSYLKDALLVWDGDKSAPGVEKTLYRGKGRWEGKLGLAAFGKQLPWEGAGYCSIGAALYRLTGKARYRKVVVETARRIMDPANGWVDSADFYQVRMDGNGAFVHFILDAYQIAPEELSDIPGKIGKMLDHVWTNAHGRARVVLHRSSDHGIRNGWNPTGGEDGYGVDEVGTVHAQGEAVRAFGVFVYVTHTVRVQAARDSLGQHGQG